MFTNTLQTTVLDNRILDYIIFIAAFLAGIVGVRLIKSIILNRLKTWSEKTSTTIDDFLVRIFEKKLIPVLYFGVFYLTVNNLTIADSISRTVDIAGIVMLTIFGLRLVLELINYSLETYWIKKEVDMSRQRSLKGILTIVKVAVWGIGITFLLDNLGFKISTVVAGLGIGGIAVALAAQTVLGDLFSYFIIFFDRPFEVGDFIIIDTYMGSIEYIGIKTTKVRSLGGEQLIFSNSDLTNSRIRNYKRMEKRRVLFSLGVIYQTTTKQLKDIPGIIRDAIEKIEETGFDRAHFASYGDFSLNFEIVYYVLSGDYGKYMDIQQEINFAIKEEFENRGIEFAYPTQTLFIEKQQEGN
ncbi:MAG TPA: mechanosensitive ion channel family protein [Nitrospirae bacterium]|nr:mechanosensitive ion channel family protein [Nitrospirota bacterium]HDO66839.1 mechanosensitive ion channel family protein [Nitrospirota bacterium]HDZ83912.1 mechanosensitive ion channel family protein [Nitrospirota bacterium]HEW81013.1 mechanosensitive ion channel family protein [Nitrospirota bacterium]